MAEKLSKQLRPASFRGVPFQVEASDIGVGRRSQVHEYPQRDKPYVDDLGRATRELQVVGFVIGDDYVARANSVLGALEEPGPGTLLHPWFGEITVSLKDLARVAFSQALGLAKITMVFVESGELAFPSSQTSTQAATRVAASNLEKAAQQSFAERFGVKGFQDFVTAAATGNLGNMLGLVSSSEIGKVLGFSNSLARTVSTAIALVSNPNQLGWHILGAFGLSGLATSAAAWSNIGRQLSRLGSSPSLSTPKNVHQNTASRRQANANAAAVYGLGRQAMIAQAVGVCSLVGSSVDTTARPVVAYDDMINVRDSVIAAIDQEVYSCDDTVYLALMNARSAVWSDLTARARDQARLTTITPPETVPALVLAYDRYEDAGRDLELVARNRIRHPGFIPSQPLKVLTR